MEEAELEESKEFMSVEEKASEAGKQHEQNKGRHEKSAENLHYYWYWFLSFYR